MAEDGVKPIAENRRARHEYHLLDRYEAGLQLTGTEVKSLRDGRVTLAQAYADLRDGEVWLIGAHIDEYKQGNVANHEPDRDRKLLLHRREIESLIGQVQQKGRRSYRRAFTSRTAARSSSWPSPAARSSATSVATSPSATPSATWSARSGAVAEASLAMPTWRPWRLCRCGRSTTACEREALLDAPSAVAEASLAMPTWRPWRLCRCGRSTRPVSERRY